MKEELLLMHSWGFLNERGYNKLTEILQYGEPTDFKGRREKALTEKATDVNYDKRT